MSNALGCIYTKLLKAKAQHGECNSQAPSIYYVNLLKGSGILKFTEAEWVNMKDGNESRGHYDKWINIKHK